MTIGTAGFAGATTETLIGEEGTFIGKEGTLTGEEGTFNGE